jgi:hypothetical protein
VAALSRARAALSFRVTSDTVDHSEPNRMNELAEVLQKSSEALEKSRQAVADLEALIAKTKDLLKHSHQTEEQQMQNV